jgi:hypothetical protein
MVATGLQQPRAEQPREEAGLATDRKLGASATFPSAGQRAGREERLHDNASIVCQQYRKRKNLNADAKKMSADSFGVYQLLMLTIGVAGRKFINGSPGWYSPSAN